MKQLNSKKTRFPWFDNILVIWPIVEVYGERNERQLCFRRLGETPPPEKYLDPRMGILTYAIELRSSNGAGKLAFSMELRCSNGTSNNMFKWRKYTNIYDESEMFKWHRCTAICERTEMF